MMWTFNYPRFSSRKQNSFIYIVPLRAGNAHRKLGTLAGAKTAFEKALTEHRTPEYRQQLSEVTRKILWDCIIVIPTSKANSQFLVLMFVLYSPCGVFSRSPVACLSPLSYNIFQVESEIKKADAAAYINPELADAEKLKGNDWSVIVFQFCYHVIGDQSLVISFPALLITYPVYWSWTSP